ncbi:hypothetical protein PJF56_21740 [Roseofilum sp. BLCC_M91]|uniref:Uncharacterized protein n=1 Tax=Roseofilum halophilum BLCC-M91 TaxID=3022259 RepID=A0ABT7BRV5_9CYAN|nr:hypothetical protein [Roseofilum halophilum]MDJ1181492.1 hypothetical protein [Roseofilum halophilum BLCC-M91]
MFIVTLTRLETTDRVRSHSNISSPRPESEIRWTTFMTDSPKNVEKATLFWVTHWRSPSID